VGSPQSKKASLVHGSAARTAALSAAAAEFEREADSALSAFLNKHGGGNGGGDDSVMDSVSLGLTVAEEGSLESSDDETERGGGEGGGEEEEDDGATVEQGDPAVWGRVALPDWARKTGKYGGMSVGLRRLELRRCGLDDLSAKQLARGLSHEAWI